MKKIQHQDFYSLEVGDRVQVFYKKHFPWPERRLNGTVERWSKAGRYVGGVGADDRGEVIFVRFDEFPDKLQRVLRSQDIRRLTALDELAEV